LSKGRSPGPESAEDEDCDDDKPEGGGAQVAEDGDGTLGEQRTVGRKRHSWRLGADKISR
jgi:hypothetical protein